MWIGVSELGCGFVSGFGVFLVDCANGVVGTRQASRKFSRDFLDRICGATVRSCGEGVS